MKPKKVIERDGDRPKCPHCGEAENKTLNSDKTNFECVACGKKFSVKKQE